MKGNQQKLPRTHKEKEMEKLEDKLKAKLKKKMLTKRLIPNPNVQQTSHKHGNNTQTTKPAIQISNPPTNKNSKIRNNSTINPTKNVDNRREPPSETVRGKQQVQHKQPKTKHFTSNTKNVKNENVPKSKIETTELKAKKKKLKKQPVAPDSTTSKRVSNEPLPNGNGAKKRMKTVNGFVEIDANDEEGIKLVEETMLKAKSTQKKREMGPPVVVHDVVEAAISSANSTDSEDDSYIDKFFKGSDDEFDENRTYSLDEIESKKANGFLSMGSEDGYNSDETSSSDIDKTNKNHKRNTKRKTNATKQKSMNNELVHCVDDSDGESSESISDGQLDGDQSSESNSSVDYSELVNDENDMLYNTDSDISLGSEVESDEMNYGSSFDETDSEASDSDASDSDASDSDEDLSEENESEDDSYSYLEGSDCSDECSHSSDYSADTFDNFMNGDDQESGSDHDYMGECGSSD